MNCPVCSKAFGTFEYRGVELDACPACEAIWFDKNEVLEVADRAGHSMEDIPAALRGEARRMKKDDLSCPKCEKTRLEVVEFESFSWHRCGGCQGVLALASELEDILKWAKVPEHLAVGLPPDTAPGRATMREFTLADIVINLITGMF